MTLVVDSLFVELAAPDADTAVARVSAALRALGPPTPEVGTLGVPLPDPVPGRWGLELSFPHGGATPDPATAWRLTHALTSELGTDARVQPCFIGAPPRFGAESLCDEADAPHDVTWHLATMRVDDAHASTRARGREPGAGVVVGHPDTGFTHHPDIWAEHASPVVSGKNFLEDGDAIDPLHAGLLLQPGHGTRTASVLVAQLGHPVLRVGGPEPVDLQGVAPAAQVRAYRVTDSVVLLGWGRRLARAIERAVDDGCDVISLSLGGLGDTRLDRAIRYAEARGVVVVAAAGNYVPWVVAPANHPWVIACAASDIDDRPWRHSASGPTVDITAPGHGVWIAAWKDAVPIAAASSGTSYATAAVAGACALWRSFHAEALAQIHRALHPAMFRAALRASARQAGLGDGFGAGVLDCQALLAQPLTRPVTEAADAEPQADQLAAILGDVAPAAASRLAALASVERAELAFHLATDPRVRTAWHDDAASPAAVPAAASRRLQIALGGQRQHMLRPAHLDHVVRVPATAPAAAPDVPTSVGVATVAIRIELDLTIAIQSPPGEP